MLKEGVEPEAVSVAMCDGIFTYAKEEAGPPPSPEDAIRAVAALFVLNIHKMYEQALAEGRKELVLKRDGVVRATVAL